MPRDLTHFFVSPESTIREAATAIDRNEKGIVLITDPQHRLLGTITDGDVRRAMLQGENLDTSVGGLLQSKKTSAHHEPTTARVGTDPSTLLQLMQDRVVRQIPLLDEHGCVADLVTIDDLLPKKVLPLQAVIMAGGSGTRLRPLTNDIPKPMLPIGEKPLIELTIERLRQAGIHRVNITTHYLSEKIKNHLGDGHNFGVQLRYVDEDSPLGTAGSLRLLETSTEPLLVINGDILTKVDFRAMLAFHREHRADLTVAMRQYDLQVPYGVVECEGANVRAIREKPLFKFFVNAGIYLLDPAAHAHIPSNQRFDMTNLIETLFRNGLSVVGFPVVEYWLDIGRLADYEQARVDMQNGKAG